MTLIGIRCATEFDIKEQLHISYNLFRNIILYKTNKTWNYGTKGRETKDGYVNSRF